LCDFVSLLKSSTTGDDNADSKSVDNISLSLQESKELLLLILSHQETILDSTHEELDDNLEFINV
jgi:endo-alpha-1,4-polygalactosaminidase (GH114 family)